MDKIYNFKGGSSTGHLKQIDNDKQFYSEEESNKKDSAEKQIKK